MGDGGLPWWEGHEEARAGSRLVLPPDLRSVLGSELLTRAFCPRETSVVNPPSLHVLSTFIYFFFFPPTLLHFDFSFEGTCQQLALRGELLAEGTAAHWNASARSCETFLRNICLHPLPSVV